MLREFFRNPLTKYLKSLLNGTRNSLKYSDFAQGYMSRVINCRVEPHVRIYDHVRVGDSSIGSYSYVAEGTRIGKTDIGRFCSIGPGCLIGLGKHPSRGFVSTSPVFFSTTRQCGTTFVTSNSFQERERIAIGNDVWIGANVLIADGVRIGDGAVIGAGAVVVCDVPDFAIYGGVPAKLIRYRFTESEICALRQIKWWDRDESWLLKNCLDFRDIELFISSNMPLTEVQQGPK